MSGVDYHEAPVAEDDFKDVCIGEIKYARLITAVREIDPEAADFLESQEVRSITARAGFCLSDDLSDAFHWASSPQGMEYWAGLYRKLQERGYDGCRDYLHGVEGGKLNWDYR